MSGRRPDPRSEFANIDESLKQMTVTLWFAGSLALLLTPPPLGVFYLVTVET